MSAADLLGVADRVTNIRTRMVEKLREIDHGSVWPSVLPPAFAEVLAAVIAFEEAEADGSPRAALLWSHYLEVMPRQRQAFLSSSNPLLHTPLDWTRLPRWRAAVGGLFAVVPGRPLLGAADAAAFESSDTLAQLYARTYYGGCMPLLYGQPADLAYVAAAFTQSGDLHATLDRYFAAPLLHELAHLDRASPALFPLYLDECVAGYVGVHAWSRFAYPHDPHADVDAIWAAPWFAQVGQALARVCVDGFAGLAAAHAGNRSWHEVLPHGLAARLERVGVDDYLRHRRPHLLADGMTPEPWLKFLFGVAGGLDLTALDQAAALRFADIPVDDETAFDAAMLHDGLRALCLSHRLEVGHYLVTPSLPPTITVDLTECVMTAGPLRYLFPPSIAQRLRKAARAFSVTVRSLSSLGELSLRLSDGKSFADSQASIERHQ